MAGTTIIPKPVETTDTRSNRGWKVVLFNDEVNLFELVILALQKAAGLSLEVAEMVAIEAHNSGTAVVKRGLDESEARIICAGLKHHSRLEGVTPGVEAIAEKDD